MSIRKNRIALTIIGIVAFAALIAGLFVSQKMHAPKVIDMEKFHGTLLQSPRQISAFSLTGMDKKPFNNDNLKGKWTYVFFGFTECGYLCPTTLAELGKMYQLLIDKKVTPRPQIVFISIDPERDTRLKLKNYIAKFFISIDPERDTRLKLKNYIAKFNPHFYAARGEETRIRKMTREYGIAYEKTAVAGAQDPKQYDVQHSGTLMLFNPQGQLHAFFTTPYTALMLAEDYQQLIN